jgi:hypothetical protein
MMTTFAGPVSTIAAALLVDHLFEPAMQPGGSLTPLFGGLVGTGPGAGMGLLMVIAGLLAASVGVLGYLFPIVRRVENILPDHDAAPTTVDG